MDLLESASTEPRARRACALLLAAAASLSGCTTSGDSVDERDHERDGPDASEAGSGALRDASERESGRAEAARPLDAATIDAARVSDGSHPDAFVRTDAAPSLPELIETFFVPTCVLGRCHTTLAPAGDLSLTNRNLSVYEALVNAPSSEVPDRMRVVPYDPAASYLMEKLESDTPTVGTRMPPPFAELPQAQIERVRAWIRAGAARD